MISIREVVRLAREDKANYDLYVGDFLNEFYGSDQENQAALVLLEPESSDHLHAHMLPFLAAATHKLCNDFGIPCPEL